MEQPYNNNNAPLSTGEPEDLNNDLDIKLSKPSSSRFFFLLNFFGFFIFAWAGCYNLYQHKFVDQKDKVQVNESSLYQPKYK